MLLKSSKISIFPGSEGYIFISSPLFTLLWLVLEEEISGKLFNASSYDFQITNVSQTCLELCKAFLNLFKTRCDNFEF